MSISTTYRQIILERLLKELIVAGEVPSLNTLQESLASFEEEHDLDKPLFDSSNYKVALGDVSSASLATATFQDILSDLRALYKHLITTSETELNCFDRWRARAMLLEGQLIDLEKRIESLLLLGNDVAGYLNYVQDTFTDLSLVDLTSSTVHCDPAKHEVRIGSTTEPTLDNRLDLNNISSNDVEFNVLSKASFLGTASVGNSDLRFAFSGIDNYWVERVSTSRPSPVTTELKVKLGSTAQAITAIHVDLHLTNPGNPLTVTPMYSLDARTWYQLPTTNITQSIADVGVFRFTQVNAQYVKFLFTKNSQDAVENGVYIYEFGVDEISFYSEGFSIDSNDVSELISQPLSATRTDGSLQTFSRVALEVCEEVPTNTTINYYITASNTSTVPLASAVWAEIDPVDRTVLTKPTVLDLGTLSQVVLSSVAVSYNKDGSGVFINPAQTFTGITAITGTTPTEVTISSSASRYDLAGTSCRILNYEISADIEIAENTIEVWRNVRDLSSTSLVRGYLNGWGFEEPYYKTTVYVSSAAGKTIDVGSKPLIVDNEPRVGTFTIAKGSHSVWVHKDRWVEVSMSGITTLAQLKTADSLYPYNHRCLVEGVTYPASWSTTEEKTYSGFDLVAEYLLDNVSVFDLFHNVANTDFSKFAIDLDAADTSASVGGTHYDKDPMKTFLVKCDVGIADFTNEAFTIKFKTVETSYQYLRLKAELSTKDASATPRITGYRIRIL